MPLDEDDDDFVAAPLLPPEDRLWRHPAEWGALSGQVPAAPPVAPRLRRSAAVAALSGLAGAVLALSFAAGASLFDGGDRSLARTDPLAALDRLFGHTPFASAAMGPAIVHVEVHIGETEVHGSGVLIASTGEVLTAAHLLTGATTIFVHDAGGSASVARVVGVDPVTDLAVVDIEGEGYDAATLGWEPELAAGDRVLVVGRDHIDAQMSQSSVRSTNTGLTAGDGASFFGLVRTASPARAGDTGGALVTPSGTVVGIVTVASAGADAGTLEASAYAVAGDIAAGVARDLLDDGEVRHAFLGIEGADLDDDARAQLGVEHGVRVAQTLTAGPAGEAGLRTDDVIVAIDGARVDTMLALVRSLHLLRAGESVEVTYERDGRRARTTVRLAQRTP